MMIGHWGELKEAESRRVGVRLELGGNNVMRRRQSSRKLEDHKRVFKGGTEESQTSACLIRNLRGFSNSSSGGTSRVRARSPANSYHGGGYDRGSHHHHIPGLQ